MNVPKARAEIAMVYYRNETRGSGITAAPIIATLERLLSAINAADAAVSVMFVRDAAIRDLNRTHRAKDVPTDVLSFPLFEPSAFARKPKTYPLQLPAGEFLLGDIVISIDTATRQAQSYDAPLTREIERLLIHGLLHLCGHDHLADDERVCMEREERRLAEVVGMPWPYERNA